MHGHRGGIMGKARFVIILSLLAASAAAHPGKLDASGCHHDRKHGGYHCHGGSSAGSSSTVWPELAAPVPSEPTAPAPSPKRSAPPATEELLPQAPAVAQPIKAPVDMPPRASNRPDAGVAGDAGVTGASAAAVPERKREPADDGASALCCGITSLLALAGGCFWMFFKTLKRSRVRTREQLAAKAANAPVTPPPQLPAVAPAQPSQPPVAPHASPAPGARRVTARRSEAEITANYNGDCTDCEWPIVSGQRIFWDKESKKTRHVDCEAARQAHAACQEEKRVEALQGLLDRLNTAKGAATRRNVIARAEKLGVTPEERLQLLLEASRLDTDDTLEKVESLKSKAVKRRRLEEALSAIRADAVPDELQADQIALLEEALRTLDAAPATLPPTTS
jgi:hypothetical protein